MDKYMEPKQATIQNILDSEHEMVLRGAEKYGDYFINASEFNDLLQNFLESADLSRYIFTAFLSQIRKHTTLAWLSATRLHHIQAMMDLRQALEAGVCAAYAIANPGQEDFVDTDENGFLDAPHSLTIKRYKWLEENFPAGSVFIKNMKETINKSVAHPNLIYAHSNFEFTKDKNKDKFFTPFFDIEKKHLIKTDLWQIANIAMGLMDLFYGVNKNLNAIKFVPDFIPRLKKLEAENHKLKAEMMTFLKEKRGVK
jgi:hypothetical protein